MLPTASRRRIGDCGVTARAVWLFIEISLGQVHHPNVTTGQKFSLLPRQVLASELVR
jgi:hypothetical protein